MGSYVFVWDKPGASNVFVTGDFDDWAKTVELRKENGVFTRQVDLPKTDKNIHYKFVVDGNWVVNDRSPTDKDAGGNTNNILKPEDLAAIPAGGRSHAAAHEAPVAAAALPSVMPGGFPSETPSAGMSSPSIATYIGDEVPDYTAHGALTNPAAAITIPPAVESETIAKASEEKEQTFSVNPIPGTAGVSNPVHVAPGEKLPQHSEFTTNTVQSNVRLDEDSYNRPDALPTAGGASANAIEAAQGAFGVPPVTSAAPQVSHGEAAAVAGAGVAGIAGAGVLASSAGSNTTTAQLAGQVPLETRGVPHVVEDSQEKAHTSGEASANPDAVADKERLEQELKAKVPEEPATSEDTLSSKALAGVATGTAVLGAGAAAAVSVLPTSIQNAISSLNNASDSKTREQQIEAGAAPANTASGVPAEVTDSIKQAHQSPEAAANPEAVAEKASVEAELQKSVPKINEAANATPAASSALSATAPAATTSGPTIADDSTIAAITMANTATPAEFKTEQSAPANGLNASSAQPAKTVATETTAQPEAAAKTGLGVADGERVRQEGHVDSRDVSPMSRPAQPTVTTGAATHSTPAKTTAGSAAVPATTTDAANEASASTSASAAADDKKGKRRSFFGRIKDKISSKN